MKLVLLKLILIVGSISYALAATPKKECTKVEAIKAEGQAANLKNWDEVYIAFTKFGHCDDGAIGEGFSESISQLLANKWDQLTKLRSLIKSNSSFETFILKHIDQTDAEENLLKIRGNAMNRCPKDSTELCKKILSALK